MREKSTVKVGDVFGYWKVIGDNYLTMKGERKWLCECTCGTTRYVLERTLRHGGSLSCGCFRLTKLKEAIGHDLKGQVFGDLKVIEQAETKGRNGGVWWICECTCGRLYEVPGTLLVKGRRTHCGCKRYENMPIADISEKRFGRLVAKYPLKERNKKGSVIWHCLCDCGREVDVSYNCLMYANQKSCGCQKIEHDMKLSESLIHVDGTSIDAIKSKKIPTSNTTGAKGVYFYKGKYHAKIVFQKKQYQLGTYRTFEEAVEARKRAEEELHDKVVLFYEKWNERAKKDPAWAEDHPISFSVTKAQDHTIHVYCEAVEAGD